MTWRTEPSIDHDRHGGLFYDDLDLQTCFDSPIAADRRTERHYRGRADVLQSFRQNGIGIDVGQHCESFFHKNFRSRQCLNRIWKQIARVRMNLELDPL